MQIHLQVQAEAIVTVGCAIDIQRLAEVEGIVD